MAITDEKKILPPSLGTVLKIAVTADIGNSQHLSSVDFSCFFHVAGREKKGVQVDKVDMIMVDEDTYIAVIDTAVIGVGNYYCCLTAFVPDDNIEGGLRKEVVRFPTYINVVK